ANQAEPAARPTPPGEKIAANTRPTLREDLGLGSTAVAELRERLSRQQGDKCAICGAAFSGKVRRHMDHCHTTKTLRGVLCGPCNFGLGFFRDDPERIIRAAEYLKQYLRP